MVRDRHELPFHLVNWLFHCKRYGHKFSYALKKKPLETFLLQKHPVDEALQFSTEFCLDHGNYLQNTFVREWVLYEKVSKEPLDKALVEFVNEVFEDENKSVPHIFYISELEDFLETELYPSDKINALTSEVFNSTDTQNKMLILWNNLVEEANRIKFKRM